MKYYSKELIALISCLVVFFLEVTELLFNETVIVYFVVEKNGTISNISIKNLNYKYSHVRNTIKEIFQLLNFIPANHNNKIVRSYFVLPVKI